MVTVGADYPLYELPEHPAGFEDVLRENRGEAKEMLEQQAKRIEESGGPLVRPTCVKGEPRRR